jgi:CBS-domain-containing membrane protein
VRPDVAVIPYNTTVPGHHPFSAMVQVFNAADGKVRVLLTAGDILHPDVLTVRDDTSAIDLAILFHEKKVNGVPVVNHTGKMVGIVSQSDLIKLAKASAEAARGLARTPKARSGRPSTLEQLGAPLYIASLQAKALLRDPEWEKSQSFRRKSVADIMTKRVVTVHPGDSIRKVVGVMVSNGINRVPVVASDGELGGMITRADIVEALATKWRRRKESPR